MEHVDVNVRIAAPAEVVWATVVAIERYPDIMDSVRAVEVLTDEGGERTSFWSVLLKGSILEWSERELLDHDAWRIDFDQFDGDLEAFRGHWQLTPIDERTTDVEMAVSFEIGIPLLADMLNPVAARALRENSLNMLHDIERSLAEAGPGGTVA